MDIIGKKLMTHLGRSNLWVNGCSFLNHRHTSEIDLDFSVAELVRDYYGFENMDNWARVGRGNDRIYLTTVNHFERNLARKRDTFVMIGWSASTRWDWPTVEPFKKMPPQDTTWCTTNMEKSIELLDDIAKKKKQRMHHPELAVVRFYQNIIGLQSYLKANKIPYVFYNSLEPHYFNGKVDHKYWQEAIDREHYFKFEYSHHQYCKKHNLFISDSDEHPSAEGHKLWADMVCNHIDNVKGYED